MGDFNRSPEALLEQQWPPALKGSIITPNVSITCNAGKGSLIDYAVASHSCHRLIHDVRAIYDGIPISTHTAIEYQLKGNHLLH